MDRGERCLAAQIISFPVSHPVKKIEIQECLIFGDFYFQQVETSYTKRAVIYVHICAVFQKAVFQNGFLYRTTNVR